MKLTLVLLAVVCVFVSAAPGLVEMLPGSTAGRLQSAVSFQSSTLAVNGFIPLFVSRKLTEGFEGVVEHVAQVVGSCIGPSLVETAFGDGRSSS